MHAVVARITLAERRVSRRKARGLRDRARRQRGSKGNCQNKVLHDLLRWSRGRGTGNVWTLWSLPPFKPGEGESFVALYCRWVLSLLRPGGLMAK
jgi:hypothetical protein